MSQLQKDALVLFRDYTLFQLKAYQISLLEKVSEGRIGGATENYEDTVLTEAIHLHRIYVSNKLSGKEFKLEL